MAKGFGIAALVFAILAIFIPVGIIVSGIAIVFSIIAALAGDRTFAIATSAIVFINTLFLSPLTWIWLSGFDPGARTFITTVLILIIALPAGAIALNATGKYALQSRT